MIAECITSRPLVPGDKAIICLGDSFTQGQGAWSSQTWKKYNNRIDHKIIKDDLEIEIYNNSWPSQLVRNYLPEYVAVNLGVIGTGNKAAVKELYLNPNINLQNISGGVLIYMLSGIERLDFINKTFPKHRHFDTVWPTPDHESEVWRAYANHIWSDKFSTIETILSIKEAETYCKANNLSLVLISAFEQRYTKTWFEKMVGVDNKNLVDSVPWDSFFNPQGCNSFIELLLKLEGKPELAGGSWYSQYSALKEPSKYITNCCHPTIDGYTVMANEIYNYLKNREMI
jgi:lysophospholipase L1-like esterase